MTHTDDLGAASQAPRVSRRVQRPVAPVQDAVVLADLSDSMNDRDGVRGERMPLRRIDRLARVLDYLLTRVRVRSLVCFNDVPVEIALSGRIALPEPTGSTGLTLALEHVAGMQPRPARCILISDGMPNSVSLALEAARALRPCVIDAYYVGPDGLDVALRFMADLAAAGGPGGKSGRFDLADPALLGTELQKRLLLAPGR